MSRLVPLSRVDIRQSNDRTTGAVTLKYVGRKLRFFERLYGYPEGVFFSLTLSELPLPEALTTLASAVGVVIDDLPLAAELRRAVAEILCVDATMQAPDYLAMCANPRAEWLDVDRRELERRHLAAENRMQELSRLIEASLRRRIASQVPERPLPAPRMFAPMPPASFGDRFAPRQPTLVPPAPVPEPEPVIIDVVPEEAETSDATTARVRAAIRTARDQELPQRLPAGARRALGRLPAGLYVSIGTALDRMNDLCAALMRGQEGGKKGGDATIIDWDGEWPVVARRYGAHGRIVYRVEDALRRNGIATEAA